MLFTTLLSTLATSALALPATPEKLSPCTAILSNYAIQAIHSTAPIHLQFLSTSRNLFFIGNDTASYCPDVVKSSGGVCPPGNETVFSGACAMDVEVPGGQQIYIAPDGSLGHTTAHSAYVPENGVQCPFTLSPAENNGAQGSVQPAAVVNTTAFGATGFMACPTPEGPYQVFAAIQNATVPMGDVKACIGFLALAYNAGSDAAAWQYE